MLVANKILNQSLLLRQIVCQGISTTCALDKYYVQKNYLKRWARRDMKRRVLLKEHEIERTSLRMIKKSDILPASVKIQAAEDIAKLPLDSCVVRLRDRCTLTDRSRGNVKKYRISRIEFRDHADKGLISGYTKSTW